jgi:phenylacetate-coenzyme A ligase PaaK-like adenylate-forming protein
MNFNQLKNKIFSIQSDANFNEVALEIFRYQYKNNAVYKEFVSALKIDSEKINHYHDIPFLPIEFFKTKKVISGDANNLKFFSSSGTTGMSTSKHYYQSIELYEQSFRKAFQQFYGDVSDYVILALLPSYLERQGSSLIYMVDSLINKSNNKKSGFYLDDLDGLADVLKKLDAAGEKILLMGVTFALLDLIEKHQFKLKNTIVMETGGMKGRRRELVREELHALLKQGFGVDSIHSEYGMTELFSQAYSKGDGIFNAPSWMKTLIRDVNDPLTLIGNEKTGGINVIDLANIHSCSFIATQDLGKKFNDGSFEVLGRFDASDIRGCNLLVG